MTAFDPAGVTWTPVSPKLVYARFVSLGLTYLVIAIVVIIVAVSTSVAWIWLILLAVTVVFAGVGAMNYFQVKRIAYAEGQEDLLIRRGFLFRSLVVVPYGRMQYVDVEAGPIMQVFGLTTVQLHTAAPETNATIPGLAPDIADHLRERLTAAGQAQLAGL